MMFRLIIQSSRGVTSDQTFDSEAVARRAFADALLTWPYIVTLHRGAYVVGRFSSQERLAHIEERTTLQQLDMERA